MKRFLLLTVVALVLQGCGGIFGKAKADATRVYLLESPSAEAACPSQLFLPHNVVAISHITVPEYLNRPHLVFRDGKGILHQDDLRRWGEPLAHGLGRIFLREMRHLLLEDLIVVAPIGGNLQPDYSVRITVDDWLFTKSKGILLHAHCEFWDTKGNVLLGVKFYCDFASVRLNSLEGLVPAMYHMAIKFAQEIAYDLRHIESGEVNWLQMAEDI
ncbi:MAG: PqiC family protein [Puniceicoccales bacterium]|jgi:uncharacterized lipoprotein YmbA|nr:PqiC family protein [Puniceicoccales bacterium]